MGIDKVCFLVYNGSRIEILGKMSRLPNKETNEAIVVLHKLGYGYQWIARALNKKKPNVIKVWKRDKDKYDVPQPGKTVFRREKK